MTVGLPAGIRTATQACSLALVGAVESSVSARRGADVHVEENAISQPAAAARGWREDGLVPTVCWFASERKESTGEGQSERRCPGPGPAILPQQQLQLSVEEPQQRPPTDHLGVAVAQCPSAITSAVPGQTLGPRGQRDHPGGSEVKPWRRMDIIIRTGQTGAPVFTGVLLKLHLETGGVQLRRSSGLNRTGLLVIRQRFTGREDNSPLSGSVGAFALVPALSEPFTGSMSSTHLWS